jgi:uridine kinase
VNPLADHALALIPRLLELREAKTTPVVLIDGHAGSGKSTLAEALKNLVFVETRQQPKIIHMDDLYPGWDGLAAGSSYLFERILKPISQGKPAQWQIWSWLRSERSGHREFDGENLLIVEGCGSLSFQNSELADFKIWIDSDPEVRKQRFFERDEGQYIDQWPAWISQEAEFYQRERSPELSDYRISN